MKHLLILIAGLILTISTISLSQITVVSTSPSDGATGVSLSTSVISITFSAAVDTTKKFSDEYGIISNLDSVVTGQWYSSDEKTVYFSVSLKSDSDYFYAVYGIIGANAETLATPFAGHFTTASSFSSTTVSGVIHGSKGIDPGHALVILSRTPLASGNPTVVAGTFADAIGNYTIPYVPNGTYYPLCAKDVNGDGSIDPSKGIDGAGTTDSVTISGADLTGIDMTLTTYGSLTFAEGVHLADSLSDLLLPSDCVLRFVQGYDVDSVGHPSDWEFYYTSASADTGFYMEVGSFEHKVRYLDSSSYHWISSAKPLTDPSSAVEPDSFVMRAELQGGSAFRHMSMPDSLELQTSLYLGNLRYQGFWDMISDTSKFYWGLQYQWGYQVTENQWQTVIQNRFLGDFSTGEILVVSGVKDQHSTTTPDAYSLNQNYPNPFNPTTNIQFSIANCQLTILKVYDVLGREVATLVDDVKQPGTYSVRWDASKQSSGVYFYRLTAGTYSEVKKLVLMK